MNQGGYIFPVLLCLLNAEIVRSALLNTNVEASLGGVCNLLVKKIGGRRLVLLIPERYKDRIQDGADCYVDVSVSENKEIKLPLMILLQRQAIIYQYPWNVLRVNIRRNRCNYDNRQEYDEGQNPVSLLQCL